MGSVEGDAALSCNNLSHYAPTRRIAIDLAAALNLELTPPHMYGGT